MRQNSRLTDIWSGQCCCHNNPDCIPMSGPIISFSPNDNSGNLGQARLTDITVGSCGHTGQIITSSTTVKCNNLGKARIGDQVTGCNIGIVVTGNPVHFVGE